MPVVSRMKKGRITLAQIQGDYQGKPTQSFTVSKSVLKDNKWEKSDFFTITDLQDLQAIVNRTINEYVKYEKVEQYKKPEYKAPQTFVEDAPQGEPF